MLHGAELQGFKGKVGESDPPLAEQDRSRAVETDRHCDQQHRNEEDGDEQRGANHVDGTFCPPIAATSMVVVRRAAIRNWDRAEIGRLKRTAAALKHRRRA
jgi:hypothetical protein